MRTRRSCTSSPLERARLLSTPAIFKEELPADSPFRELSISYNEIRRLIIDEKKVEKALNMSFRPKLSIRWFIVTDVKIFTFRIFYCYLSVL